MKIRNQNIFNFSTNKNFNYEDYFVSKSNYFAFEILQKWPKWEQNILNIYGESFSGKTHLSKIFLGKNNGLMIYEKDLVNKILFNLQRHLILCEKNTGNWSVENINDIAFKTGGKYIRVENQSNAIVPIIDEINNIFTYSFSFPLTINHWRPNTWETAVKGKTTAKNFKVFLANKKFSPRTREIIGSVKNLIVKKNKNPMAINMYKKDFAICFAFSGFTESADVR